MGRAKDQMIEEAMEERQNLNQALDDIEAYGDRHECPNEHCRVRVCSKECFARGCFDWCLTHEHPSVEKIHGTVSVTVHYTTKDAEGNLVSHTEVEDRRVCGHGDENEETSWGDCNIVVASFTCLSEFYEEEMEREMMEMMAKDSP